MSSNTGAKRTLMLRYGKKCFIEELGLRSPEEVQQDLKRYKSKKKIRTMQQLSYHHIREKRKGGKATEQNGAIVRNINHQWLHSLPAEQQREINEMFKDYKKSFKLNSARLTTEGIDEVQETELPEIEEDCIEIDLKENEPETMTPEELRAYEEYKRKKIEREYAKFKVETPEQKRKREQREIFEDNLMEMRY